MFAPRCICLPLFEHMYPKDGHSFVSPRLYGCTPSDPNPVLGILCATLRLDRLAAADGSGPSRSRYMQPAVDTSVIHPCSWRASQHKAQGTLWRSSRSSRSSRFSQGSRLVSVEVENGRKRTWSVLHCTATHSSVIGWDEGATCNNLDGRGRESDNTIDSCTFDPAVTVCVSAIEPMRKK